MLCSEIEILIAGKAIFNMTVFQLNNSLDLVYGSDFNSPVNRVAFHQQYKHYNNQDGKKGPDFGILTKNERKFVICLSVFNY